MATCTAFTLLASADLVLGTPCVCYFGTSGLASDFSKSWACVDRPARQHSRSIHFYNGNLVDKNVDGRDHEFYHSCGCHRTSNLGRWNSGHLATMKRRWMPRKNVLVWGNCLSEEPEVANGVMQSSVDSHRSDYNYA
jgi:hypothetical protein